MIDVSQIDKNFRINTNINKPDIHFYNVNQEPFSIHGVFYENGKYRRLPEAVAKTVSAGVYYLHTNTAGGRVRFKTDSTYLAIYAKLSGAEKMPHFALTGSIGFDVYIKEGEDKPRYHNVFIPNFDTKEELSSVMELGEAKLREITVNMPLYSNVLELYIGISENAFLQSATPYKHPVPIIYYGSSITQGACATRAGNTYQNRLSREFDCDYVSLGFSGNALGELELAEYIKGLEMSMFVYDYDHNAPTLEHLKTTHERMFKLVRQVHPNIPIIIMTRPKFKLTEHEKQRFAIIKETYDNAIATGDKNVYFLSGQELMSIAEDDGIVDVCHPNDFGFASMAKVLGNLIKENSLI